MTINEGVEKVLRVVQYIAYVLPVIILGAALPLALKMIAPNNTYGIRTAKTFESADTWYAVNSLGGLAMVAAAVISIITLIWMQSRWQVGPIIKLLAMLFVPLLIILAGVFAVIALG
jgi:uncharacterized membrane protein